MTREHTSVAHLTCAGHTAQVWDNVAGAGAGAGLGLGPGH